MRPTRTCRCRRSSYPSTVRRAAARATMSVNALVLEAEGLTKSFGALKVLDGVDLSLAPGEALGVVGPNGAGKTTLLSVLVGAQAPTSGKVRFRGEDVMAASTAERCRRGLVRTHQIPRPF